MIATNRKTIIIVGIFVTNKERSKLDKWPNKDFGVGINEKITNEFVM